jgi:hypothetical protein
MLTRSLQASTVGRAAQMRRNRRRLSGSSRLYCSTNGCASFLELHPERGEATCPVCGYHRRLN